jgi:hypothetical protein
MSSIRERVKTPMYFMTFINMAGALVCPIDVPNIHHDQKDPIETYSFDILLI